MGEESFLKMTSFLSGRSEDNDATEENPGVGSQ